MAFYYLATPYSRYPKGTEAAFRDASYQASLLLKAGIPVFCPIAHTHPIAVEGQMDLMDLSIWLPADEPFMAAATGIIVCKMETWEISTGVRHEIERFRADGKPVIYMEPGVVPEALAR